VKRRDFIALLGGVAARGARAAGRAGAAHRVLIPYVQDNPVGQARIAALLQELQQLGWTDGRNVRVDIRWAGANPENIRKEAAELVALAPDVIQATGSASVTPLLQATRTVPVVFVVVPDPVGAGFVDSLARPGGNATGFLMSEYGSAGNGWSC
jgi:putative tryptophan/tyrosine transport system substrate-binding protein